MAAALASSRRALHTLHRHLLLHPSPATAALRAPPTPIPRHFPSSSTSFSSSFRFFSAIHPEARLPHKLMAPPRLPQQKAQRLLGGFRSFATGGGSKLAPLGQGVKGLGRPVEAAKGAAARYRQAVGLQVEAFWSRNYMLLVGAGAVIVCIALWRVMFGIASTFVGLSEGMAKYGFLALPSAIVAFGTMYTRARFTINPDKVYKIAMTKLNTSAAIPEVMGAPLTGTDIRAYVMSRGGPKLKDFIFRLGGKGTETKGLVSVEIKKKKGQVISAMGVLGSVHIQCRARPYGNLDPLSARVSRRGYSTSPWNQFESINCKERIFNKSIKEDNASAASTLKDFIRLCCEIGDLPYHLMADMVDLIDSMEDSKRVKGYPILVGPALLQLDAMERAFLDIYDLVDSGIVHADILHGILPSVDWGQTAMNNPLLRSWFEYPVVGYDTTNPWSFLCYLRCVYRHPVKLTSLGPYTRAELVRLINVKFPMLLSVLYRKFWKAYLLKTVLAPHRFFMCHNPLDVVDTSPQK